MMMLRWLLHRMQLPTLPGATSYKAPDPGHPRPNSSGRHPEPRRTCVSGVTYPLHPLPRIDGRMKCLWYRGMQGVGQRFLGMGVGMGRRVMIMLIRPSLSPRWWGTRAVSHSWLTSTTSELGKVWHDVFHVSQGCTLRRSAKVIASLRRGHCRA